MRNFRYSELALDLGSIAGDARPLKLNLAVIDRDQSGQMAS